MNNSVILMSNKKKIIILIIIILKKIIPLKCLYNPLNNNQISLLNQNKSIVPTVSLMKNLSQNQ